MPETLIALIALGLLYLGAAVWIERRTNPYDEHWFALVPVGCFLGLAITLVIVFVWEAMP